MENKRNTLSVIMLLGLVMSCSNQNHSTVSPDMSKPVGETGSYSERNHGTVSYDVSMPIDATGYKLRGKNLKGGPIQFSDSGSYIAEFMSHETGNFETPLVTAADKKPLIRTKVSYDAIKFINPLGINNFFIKVGMAERTQNFSGLDPFVIKNGTYTWKVPLFSVGNESNDVEHKSENVQFMQVGGIGKDNAMYTQQFYLYLQGNGNAGIVGHPIRTTRSNEILSDSYTDHYSGYTSATWNVGDPYTTKNGPGGPSSGTTTTFPAGPNLDYEYGVFELPTVHTPWSATPSEHCMLGGKEKAGCVDAKIGTTIHYMAQKIRIPVDANVTVYAEFGSAYRRMTPENVRYALKSNVFLKGLINPDDSLKKSYIDGGSSETFFAVGYEFKDKNNRRYSARYIFIPGKENANRLAWRDAPIAQMYVYSVSDDTASEEEIRDNFREALHAIRKIPALYEIVGKNFFEEVLKKNKL